MLGSVQNDQRFAKCTCTRLIEAYGITNNCWINHISNLNHILLLMEMKTDISTIKTKTLFNIMELGLLSGKALIIGWSLLLSVMFWTKHDLFDYANSVHRSVCCTRIQEKLFMVMLGWGGGRGSGVVLIKCVLFLRNCQQRFLFQQWLISYIE